MTTQRGLEPHVFYPYRDASQICRHCDRGQYASIHDPATSNESPAPRAGVWDQPCSHSDKKWRHSGNNPADVMCEYDYIATGTTCKHTQQIITEHNQHTALVAQRDRLLVAAKFLLAMNATNYDREVMRSEGGFEGLQKAVDSAEQEGKS